MTAEEALLLSSKNFDVWIDIQVKDILVLVYNAASVGKTDIYIPEHIPGAVGSRLEKLGYTVIRHRDDDNSITYEISWAIF